MKKRKIIVTSSIAVALFIGSLGVSSKDFREDLGIDPTFTESLVSQGFSPSQIQKIFASASPRNDYDKMPLSE